MRLVLSEKDLSGFDFPDDVEVKKIRGREVERYQHDSRIVAIVGSRALSIKCVDLDFPALKLVQLTSAGFDGVPLDLYAKHGIAVANAGTVYSVPIAETVVFGMLQIAKKLRKNPNNRAWKLMRRYHFISELCGKYVLILGAGNIGTAVAERLGGFAMKVDAYDPFCLEKPQFRTILRNFDALKANLTQYDYIVSTLPDNKHTRGMIGKGLFSCMKETAVVINVGRKAVFQEDEFYAALKTKQIGGAVLDMFEKFPNPITNKFRRLGNVIVLPGVAAISQEVNVRLREHICRNVRAAVEGTAISNVVNGVE